MDEGAGLGARIDRRLEEFLADRAEQLARVGPETASLLVAARAAVGGGKRLRPAFCVAGWRAAGADPADPRVDPAAAALELLQASALVHDDLIDASLTRRGRPAAHRAFAGQHDDSGWLGDPGRFGAGAAVLLGDLLLGWAHELLRSTDLDPRRVARGAACFDAATTEVVAGQYLDLVAQAAGSTDDPAAEDVALRVVRWKAASYTVVRPLQLGAALAGGDDALLAGLEAYGTPVGVAFQLRDDVLGVFGDPEHTGKPAGDDLREGKRTVLLARTAGLADPAGRALLDRLVGDPDLDAEGLRRVRDLITGCGALAGLERTIVDLEADALAALDRLGLPGPVHAELAGLAGSALRRTR